jgi:hypothetical protein
MIGGTDVVFWVRDDLPAAELILSTVRRHWPQFVFQNAEDASPLPAPNGSGVPQPSGREFFVYKDGSAARNWQEDGAVPANANTMLHVILGHGRKPEAGLRSLTLVCDEQTGEMNSIIDDIKRTFRDATDTRHPAYHG